MVLEKEVNELEALMPFYNVKNSNVSSRGVDWHIDHCLKIITGVSDLLRSSNPDDYKWKFNVTRFYVFIKGAIPRGKAKAPKAVNNKEEILLKDLESQLTEVKNKISGLENLPAKANFKHLYFGCINRDETIKFLTIHTNHHLKIMRDIIDASK